MDLSNILTINGKQGLFKLVSKSKANFIVESLIDQKRMPAFSHDGVSSLDNIAIFTETDDIPLQDVFRKIYEKENGKAIPDILNDNNKLKTYFGEVLPDYDKERVYVSNIKKVLSWYNLLVANNLIDMTEDAVVNDEMPSEKTEEK